MIREKELTEGEINTARGQLDDEAGLQASLGLMERRAYDPNHYKYWEITRHVRAIGQMRNPSWLKFSLEDGANLDNRLRRFKTPSGINAAVTWFLQGTRFGVEASEADQDRKLIAFLGDLSDLADKVTYTPTIREVFELMVKPDTKGPTVYDLFQKSVI